MSSSQQENQSPCATSSSSNSNQHEFVPMTHRDRLQQHQLYSFIVSSNGMEYHGAHCRLSLFATVYRCRTASHEINTHPIEESSLMNDQNIKKNMSYISLSNLSNMIDHEPNVSRKNSYLRSTSTILAQKPSLFLTDILSKMTKEQLAKSIAHLTQLHENRTKSNTTVDKLQRIASLPDLRKKPTTVHSVTSLLPERKQIQEDMISVNMSLKRSNDEFKTDVNETSTSVVIYDELQLSSHHLKSLDQQSIPNLAKSNNSNTNINNEKDNIDHSAHFLTKDFNEQRRASKSKHGINTSQTKQNTIQPSISLNYIKSNSKSTNQSLKDSSSGHKVNESLLSTPVKETHMLSHEKDTNRLIESQYTKSTEIRLTPLPFINNDDDEKLKRNSLGLARDSLELIRNSTSHHNTSFENIIPQTDMSRTYSKQKPVLKSRCDSSEIVPTPELVSYMAIDEVQGDKRLLEKQIRRRSLSVGGGTIISCTSPKPKRDSLILIQERYSGLITPHSGCYHLPGSDSRHVEFIREPGDTITPVLHIGRGTQLRHPSNRLMSPTFSSDYYERKHSNHTFDSSQRSKSEVLFMGTKQCTDIGMQPKHLRMENGSPDQNQESQFTSTKRTLINADGVQEHKVCLDRSDYDEMVRLIMVPLLKTNSRHSVKTRREPTIELCINNYMTTFQGLILLVVSIFFYIFIFIKSQYWQEYHQK